MQVLDDLGVIYFVRSGTELGLVRDSKFTADTDIDIFVDMPSKKLVADCAVHIIANHKKVIL